MQFLQRKNKTKQNQQYMQYESWLQGENKYITEELLTQKIYARKPEKYLKNWTKKSKIRKNYQFLFPNFCTPNIK